MSGGAARGAYEAGVAMSLLASERFDLICGSSIGAMNGAFIAMGAYDRVVSTWRAIAKERIIRFSLRTALGRMGFVSNEPLRRLIGDALKLSEFQASFVAAATNLNRGTMDAFFHFTGDGAPLQEAQFRSKQRTAVALEQETVVDAVLASAALPPVFAPVRLRDASGSDALYADAAIANNSPIGQAIDAGADEITVVFMQHSALRYKDYRVRHVGHVGIIAQDVVQQRLLDLDLKLARATNENVRNGVVPGKRYVDIRIIAPSVPLRLAAMDLTNQRSIDRVFAQGAADGREAALIAKRYGLEKSCLQ